MKWIYGTLVLFSLSVISLNAQVSTVSIQLKNATIKEILQEIEEASGYSFLYSSRLVDVNRRMDASYNAVPVTQILDRIFEGTGTSYKVEGKQILLQGEEQNARNRQDSLLNISGTVKNTDGESLPGVSILVKGSYKGSISDPNGNYTISDVGKNETLIFSFIGMKTIEVAVKSRTVIDIVLEQELYEVEELVVTALGIKRSEKALGYSVQNVSGESISTVKGVDIGTSLTGKVAGLLVLNSTDFAAAPEILIRGESPLIVIDGVPYENMTLRDLPSDDIESLSVLKGATASALYGFRGQSGAIMITTRKGSAAKGVTVSINNSTMFTAGFVAIPEMQSTYGRLVSSSTNTYTGDGQGSWGPPLEGQDVIQWDPINKEYRTMPYLPIGADNFKNFLEQGYILNNNVSVVQQGEFGSIRSSISWVNNKGQYPNSFFDKVTYNLGGDMKMNRFELSSSIAYNKQVSPNIGFTSYTGYDPMYNLLIWSSPDYDVLQYKDYWLVPNESQNSSYTSINNNPYFDRYERIHSLNKDIINGTVSAGYELAKGIKATIRSGFDIYSDHQTVRISMGSFQGGGSSTVIKGGKEVWGESLLGSYNYGLGRGFSINNDLLLTVNKSLGMLNIDGLAGGTIFLTQDEGIEARTQGGLSLPGFYSLKASVNQIWVDSRVSKMQVNSLFGRLALSWSNFLFAEGTLRNDWSSTLPASTRSYLYPSVSGSIIISELLPEKNWLSLWKLRTSWTTSRTPATIYDINTVYTVTTNAWGDLSSASYPTAIRGTDVMPESSATFEVGSLINLYSGRASLDIAYYRKRMYDFIKFATISYASGVATNYVNTDEEITRKGAEISGRIVPVKTKNFSWDLEVNWSKYARYYTKLDSVYSADQAWVQVGERADHYIYKEFLRDPDGNIIHTAGLPDYSPYYSLAGYKDPDWIWGLQTAVHYRNFTLSISADGRIGGLAQSYTEMYMWNSGNHPESITEERYLDATVTGSKNYLSEGVTVVSGTVSYDAYGNITEDTRVYAPNQEYVTYESYIKRIHKGTAWGGVPSPFDLYSTTFFKVREISLSYNIPNRVCSVFRAKNGSISLVGQNLLFWARDFKYSDPDGGTENFADPSQRFIGVNVRLTF